MLEGKFHADLFPAIAGTDKIVWSDDTRDLRDNQPPRIICYGIRAE